MQRHEIIKKFGRGQSVNNRTFFHYPEIPVQSLEFACKDEESFSRLYKIKLNQQKNKAVTDILRALDVEISPIECIDYRSFYEKMIEQLQDVL